MGESQEVREMKVKVVLMAIFVALLATGCATTAQVEADKAKYMAYAAACTQNGGNPVASFTDSGGKQVKIYNQGGCGVRPPGPMPKSNIPAMVAQIAKYGVMGLLGFKLFDEGVALGIGTGIGALSSSNIGGDGFIGNENQGFNPVDNTAPPAFPPLAPVE